MNSKKALRLIWNFCRLDLQFYIFIIALIMLPLTRGYLPHLTFAWVVAGAFSIRRINIQTKQFPILLIFPVIFYFILAIGMAYTDNIKNGIFDLEVKLSILFLPMVTFFITNKIKLNYRLLLKLFVLGNFVASLICLGVALKNSIQIDELGNILFESSHWPTVIKDLSFIELIIQRYSNFSYNFLSFIHHSTYYSIYILFSIAIVVYLLRSTEKRKYRYYFLIIYFTIFIWLLSSRAAYITYLICLASFFLVLIFKYKKYWIGMLVLGVGITLALIALSNKQLRKNINESIQVINQKSLNKDSDIRLWIWRSGIEVLKDHIIFGVGTGDIDEVLNEKYKKYNLELADEHNYNAHNQYLDIALKTGVFGLIIFLGWLTSLLYITIKRKQFLFFYFTVILMINFFFEVILNSIAGVSFFAFFYCLLYVMYNNQDSKD